MSSTRFYMDARAAVFRRFTPARSTTIASSETGHTGTSVWNTIRLHGFTGSTVPVVILPDDSLNRIVSSLGIRRRGGFTEMRSVLLNHLQLPL